MKTTDIDAGPLDPDNNERAYYNESKMSSFLPTNVHRKKKRILLMKIFKA